MLAFIHRLQGPYNVTTLKSRAEIPLLVLKVRYSYQKIVNFILNSLEHLSAV